MAPEPTDSAASGTRIVGASADRTLVARREVDGRVTCFKRYETGTPAEAERELAMGRLAAGPGVGAHLGVTVDPENGRPCLELEFLDGIDLDALLRREGVLSVRATARIGAAIATILARLAGLRDERAPSGMVHGDLKPSNVMVLSWQPERDAVEVALVDFEHAAAIGPAFEMSGTFTGGTHGFAPKESYDGASPQPGADVFALGAVMFALCTGSPPFRGRDVAALRDGLSRGLRGRWRLEGIDPRLATVLERCLSPVASARPTANELATELDAIASSQEGTRARREAARLQALSGDAHGLDQAFRDDSRRRTRLARRARIGREAPLPMLDPSAPIEVLAGMLGAAAHHVTTLLRIAPGVERARERRTLIIEALRRVLRELPPAIQELRRAARPVDALACCESALAAARLVGRVPLTPGAQVASTAARDPERFLERLRRDLDTAAAAHARIIDRIHSGEADGDLVAIDGAIAELTAMYGGSSPAVAEARDRRARFEFYLGRLRGLTRARATIATLAGELGQECRLETLDVLGGETRDDGETHPPRALLRALKDVAKEFPALAPRLDPAQRAVQVALTAITTNAWLTIADAGRKLATPPIPIRPLSTLLERLDRLRQADAFVDVLDGSRADLFDAIESVRVKLDSARAERDRLTLGAREALDRGHLTTAIFDMERAADRFDAVDDHSAGNLASEYESAKLRKRQVEEALEQNHALAARYGELCGAPGSTPQERLAALREREQCLTFLASSLGAERGAPYAQDLRDAKLDVLRETAADGERRLATARHDEERRAIAQRTLDALLHALPESASDAESREVRALIQVWTDRGEAANQALRSTSQTAVRRSPHPGWLAVAGLAILGAIVVVLRTQDQVPDPAIALHGALGEPTPLGESATGTVEFDATRAVATLRDFARTLGDLKYVVLSVHAESVVSAVDDIAAGRRGYHEARAEVLLYRSAIETTGAGPIEAACSEFGQRALRAAFVTAVLRRDRTDLDRVLRDDTTLRQALSVADAGVLERLLAQ